MFAVALHAATAQCQTKERRQVVVSSALNEIFRRNFSVGPRWKVAFADKEIEGQSAGKVKIRLCGGRGFTGDLAV